MGIYSAPETTMHLTPAEAELQAELERQNGHLFTLSPEDYPNLDDIVTDDGAPLDNVFVEKQQRLLVETAYASPEAVGGGGPFVAMSNVGLFYQVPGVPLVPDVLLSRKVRFPDDIFVKHHRSYFGWVYGKAPDVVIEIVSDRRGGKATHKLQEYARIGVTYYVIFDPEEHLGEGVLRAFALRDGQYELIDSAALGTTGLGLTLWSGTYEDLEGRWLRWCDRDGRLLPTGLERSAVAEQRAEITEQLLDEEKQRTERLRAKLRELGVDPDT